MFALRVRRPFRGLTSESAFWRFIFRGVEDCPKFLFLAPLFVIMAGGSYRNVVVAQESLKSIVECEREHVFPDAVIKHIPISNTQLYRKAAGSLLNPRYKVLIQHTTRHIDVGELAACCENMIYRDAMIVAESYAFVSVWNLISRHYGFDFTHDRGSPSVVCQSKKECPARLTFMMIGSNIFEAVHKNVGPLQVSKSSLCEICLFPGRLRAVLGCGSSDSGFLKGTISDNSLDTHGRRLSVQNAELEIRHDYSKGGGGRGYQVSELGTREEGRPDAGRTYIPNGLLVPIGFAQATVGIWLAFHSDRWARHRRLGRLIGLGVASSAPFIMLLGWGLLNLWNGGLF